MKQIIKLIDRSVFRHEISIYMYQDGQPVHALTSGTAKGIAITPNGERLVFENELDLTRDGKWVNFVGGFDGFEIHLSELPGGASVNAKHHSWEAV